MISIRKLQFEGLKSHIQRYVIIWETVIEEICFSGNYAFENSDPQSLEETRLDISGIGRTASCYSIINMKFLSNGNGNGNGNGESKYWYE